MSLDVLCPTCGLSFHETTDKYNPNCATNGSMLKLKDKYIDFGWSDFGHDVTVIFDQLTCANCGSPMADFAGKVKTKPQNGSALEPVEIIEVLKVPESLSEPKPESTGDATVVRPPTTPKPKNKVVASPPTQPVDRLTAFLSAKPEDPWTGESCGCEKTRAEFGLEADTCSECVALRDETAMRKKK